MRSTTLSALLLALCAEACTGRAIHEPSRDDEARRPPSGGADQGTPVAPSPGSPPASPTSPPGVPPSTGYPEVPPPPAPPPSPNAPPPSQPMPPPAQPMPPPVDEAFPPALDKPLGPRLLVGYWHNFMNGSGFIKLREVSPKWDVINVSFAEPVDASMKLLFEPFGYTSPNEFARDVAILKSRGQKVIISIGGANGHVELKTDAQKQAFIEALGGIVQRFGFDGIDIDFEGQSLYLDPGDTDVTRPKTPVLVNLIAAIRALRERFGAGFLLTMAPETFFVQVGYGTYGGRAGAYLPVIHALRDILTFLQVQHYNSGPVMGLDDQFHTMGSAQFHVVMADMVLRGFPLGKNPANMFPPLRQDQVVIGLPAASYAGNGYTAPDEVHKALNCLVRGTDCGSYRPPTTYPRLRGLMTWSINWDSFTNFGFSNPHRAFLDALPAAR
jgi:chitinase